MSRDPRHSDVTNSLRANRLRELREQRGLSQRELSRLSGVAQTLISRYENGTSEPLASAVVQLARTLNVSADYLFGLSDIPQNPLAQDLPPEERKLLEAFGIGDYLTMLEIVTERLRTLKRERSSGGEE